MKKKQDFNEVLDAIQKAHPDFERKDAFVFFAFWAYPQISESKINGMLEELSEMSKN